MLGSKYQAYAEAVAGGSPELDAYRRAFPSASVVAARKGVARMSQNVAVCEEIQRIRKAAELLAGGAVLSLMEKRLYLAGVVRTPLGEVNASSIYCTEMIRSRLNPAAVTSRELAEPEQGEFWVTEKVKKPCPLAAIRLDAELAGELDVVPDLAGLTDGIAALLTRI